MLEFLLVSDLFSITTADLMAKRKARSPTLVSSCFRHYKQQGNVHALSLSRLLQFIYLWWVDFQVVPLQNADIS